jgi:hypothetical protein
MRLPQQLTWEDADNKWAAMLNPIINNPANNSLLLTNIQIKTGPNVINHRLGRKIQGWVICGIDGVASIYDTQASNQMPNLTLNLTSDADVTLSLLVF